MIIQLSIINNQQAMPKIKKTIEKTEKKEVKKTVEKKQAKKTKAKPVVKAAKAKAPARKAKYWEGVGRRKTGVAQVRIFSKGNKEFIVNTKELKYYFPIVFLREIANSPLEVLSLSDKFKVLVKVSGGGINAQAEAIRHGLSRALIKFNPNFRKKLKKFGFLTRDSRMKERKKFGLKRARRAPQWQKR